LPSQSLAARPLRLSTLRRGGTLVSGWSCGSVRLGLRLALVPRRWQSGSPHSQSRFRARPRYPSATIAPWSTSTAQSRRHHTTNRRAARPTRAKALSPFASAHSPEALPERAQSRAVTVPRRAR